MRHEERCARRGLVANAAPLKAPFCGQSRIPLAKRRSRCPAYEKRERRPRVLSPAVRFAASRSENP